MNEQMKLEIEVPVKEIEKSKRRRLMKNPPQGHGQRFLQWDGTFGGGGYERKAGRAFQCRLEGV